MAYCNEGNMKSRGKHKKGRGGKEGKERAEKGKEEKEGQGKWKDLR